MDNETKHIVASNLTAAYCGNHSEALSEEEIIEVYLRFLKLLTPPSGKFSVSPLNL
jgi:hypothetical protein